MRSSKRWGLAAPLLVVLAAVAWAALPYLTSALLIVRVANVGGRLEAFADARARDVIVYPPRTIPSRHGEVPAQVYEPAGRVGRTVLMIPGIHSFGIEEPRLTGLARDMAGSGVRVVTMALPDLTRYRITPNATDVIEDAVAWLADQPEYAPDGKVGVVGISFAGGLSVAAAGRERIRDRLAYVVSFGGHGDLPRVMRYLATGEAAQAPGVATFPPHDYGVAVILYGLADQGVVPAEQVAGLREGIRTFLYASQLTLVNMDDANAAFLEAREKAAALPEPAQTYMSYVNDRVVSKLGPILVPYLDALEADDPALSPERAAAPSAPIFLLHGHEDNVIPAAESVVLGNHLREQGVNVTVLLSELITHAELDRGATVSDSWKLVSFWAGVLRH